MSPIDRRKSDNSSPDLAVAMASRRTFSDLTVWARVWVSLARSARMPACWRSCQTSAPATATTTATAAAAASAKRDEKSLSDVGASGSGAGLACGRPATRTSSREGRLDGSPMLKFLLSLINHHPRADALPAYSANWINELLTIGQQPRETCRARRVAHGPGAEAPVDPGPR